MSNTSKLWIIFLKLNALSSDVAVLKTRFRWYGRIAIILGLAAVFTLFVDIISKGHGAFKATYIQLEVHYDPEVIGINSLTDKSLLMQAQLGCCS